MATNDGIVPMNETIDDHSLLADDYEEDVDFTEPCKGPRCKLCKQIVPGNTHEQYGR